MIGSTIIWETNVSRLEAIKNPEDLDGFNAVCLDVMTILDFQSLLSNTGIDWVAGNPVVYDAEGGMALFKVNEEGLQHVLSLNGKLTEAQEEDLQKLRAFVHAHGIANVFEFTTF